MKIDFTATATTEFDLSISNIEFYTTEGELALSVPVKGLIEYIEANELNYLGDQEVCINDSPFEKVYKSKIQSVFCYALEYLDKHFEEVTEMYYNQLQSQVGSKSEEVRNAA